MKTFHSVLACAAICAAVLTTASAPTLAATNASPVAAAFKGTIISTYSDGRQGKLWLAEDGSYKAEGRKHDPSNGHWTLKGENICLRQSSPMTLPISYCTAVPSGKVGSSWAAKSPLGDPIRVKLVAGGRSGA